MASRTSYFNLTLWAKTMHRFWPLWAVYLVGWLFLLPFNILTNYASYSAWLTDTERTARMVDAFHSIPDFLQGGVWIAAGYCALCAMAVFGYLYNNRSAAMMHALPLRRESLFGTQYAAGISYFLLPHLAVALVTLAVSLLILPSAHWSAALQGVGIWFAVQSAVCLFLSFAAFCAMFTGHILALPAFYGILNCLVVVIYSLTMELSTMVFFGVRHYSSDHPLVVLCTPIYALFEACNWRRQREDIIGVLGDYESQVVSYYMESPGTVVGYAVAGLVFAALALMVYRRHHVESAGDVVSVPLVRPVFRIGVAFCAGLCFGTFTSAFFGWADTPLLVPTILFWTAIGWFAAEMLLRKSFRVLRAGWKGCLCMVAAMLLLSLVCAFDLLGVERRVPDPDQVLSLSVDMDLGAPYDEGSYLSKVFESPEDIATFIALHQAVADNVDYYKSSRGGDDYVSLTFNYRLKNGTDLRRSYNSLPIHKDEVNQPGSLTQQMALLCADRDLVRLAYGLDGLVYGQVVQARLLNVYDRLEMQPTRLELDMVSVRELEQLWLAVQRDFEEGTLGVRYLFDDEARYANTYYTDLRLYFELPQQARDPHIIHPTAEAYSAPADAVGVSTSVDITLTPNARNTLNWLNSSGVLGNQYQLLAHSESETLYAPEFEKLWQEYGLDSNVHPVPLP